MSFEVENSEEQQAWDAFASAALQGIVQSKTISDEAAAKTAALFADKMVLQRRERKSKPGQVSRML